MKALITGATGFVGGALARRLHGLGWQVVGLGRNWEAGKQLAAAGMRGRQSERMGSFHNPPGTG